MSRISVSGKNPNGKPCPRCGKVVSIWWNGKFAVIPKHRNNDGKPCRGKHPPRPDLDGKKAVETLERAVADISDDELRDMMKDARRKG